MRLKRLPLRRLVLRRSLDMVRVVSLLFIGCLFSAAVLASDGTKTPAFKLSVTTSTNLSLTGDGFAPVSKVDPVTVGESAQGAEHSQCQVYGRPSSAQASANAAVTARTEDSLELSLSTSVRSQGGHYRTCLLGCALGQCLGLHGNDTKAQANAQASATITVTFASDFPATDYLLDFASNNAGGQLRVALTDKAGNSIPTFRSNGESQILRGTPGAVYFLTVSLPLAVSDGGGCCSAEQQGTALVLSKLRLLRAPIIASKAEFTPFIAGGSQTLGYPNVGAIKLGADLHCTGTIIGKHTVVTAAHCIYEYEERLTTTATFFLGANINQGVGLKITGSEIPTGPTLAYDPKHYQNDIGLIYVEDVGAIESARLHSGQPTWNDLIDKKVSLVFVGYGYDVIKHQVAASGIKREAPWYISAFDTSTVRFPPNADGKNTCKGDSGGPAFLIDQGEFTLVAITSGSADGSCENGGTETRIDYFRQWITARIK